MGIEISTRANGQEELETLFPQRGIIRSANLRWPPALYGNHAQPWEGPAERDVPTHLPAPTASARAGSLLPLRPPLKVLLEL